MQKPIVLTLTPQEFFLLKGAVEELLNDSDFIWGNCDVPDGERLYDEAKRLADRLCKIEQMVVIPH
jgi:hypothetical protein